MAAELIVIGCRAGSPGMSGPASGYVVRLTCATLLVDCGPGVVAGLAARGLIGELDGVIVTHPHADHCADLIALAYHRSFPRSLAPLPLFGPPALEAVIAKVDEAFGIPSLPELRAPIAHALPFNPLVADDLNDVLGCTVRTFTMNHPVQTFALRFEDIGLTYTADGALSPELVAFAQGSHVLLAEATYLNGEGRDLIAHGHMTAATVARLGLESGAQRLVVTHASDCAEVEAIRQEAERLYGAPVLAASPGLSVTLG
jgi:ribonuclease BN (tRNA processing enzyme)